MTKINKRHKGEEARQLSAKEMLAANNHRMALRTMTAEHLAAVVVAPPPRSQLHAVLVK